MLCVSERIGIKLKEQRKKLSSVFCTLGNRRRASGSISHICNMLSCVSMGSGWPLKGGVERGRVGDRAGKGQRRRENTD